MPRDKVPYVKVADSVIDEPWPHEVKAMVVMLSCLMHQRWRAGGRGFSLEDAATITLDLADAQKITGRSRRDIVAKSLALLPDFLTISVVLAADFWRIHWPKWAEFQGSGVPNPAPSVKGTGETETATRKSVRGPTKSDAKRRSESRRPSKIPPAWALGISDEMIEALRGVRGAVIGRGARTAWARDIAALRAEAVELARLDDDEASRQIQRALAWALGPENLDQEFEVVIRSGGALRKKWPQLVAGARRRRREREGSVDTQIKNYLSSDRSSGGEG